MVSNELKDNIEQKFIADNLSALLKQHHLNANQLAQQIGLPMMTLRRLLSGETEDPRISTLKLIASYFDVTVDQLIGEDQRNILISTKKIKSYLIPKLTWESLVKLDEEEDFSQTDWNDWQTISLNETYTISKKTFALESRPSMFPRFPKGTIFIIDPDTKPADGDIVLIKIKENNTYTLRELIIDPPDWRLAPLVTDSNTINFSAVEHEIAGVCLLTILYHPKIHG